MHQQPEADLTGRPPVQPGLRRGLPARLRKRKMYPTDPRFAGCDEILASYIKNGQGGADNNGDMIGGWSPLRCNPRRRLPERETGRPLNRAAKSAATEQRHTIMKRTSPMQTMRFVHDNQRFVSLGLRKRPNNPIRQVRSVMKRSIRSRHMPPLPADQRFCRSQ